VRATVVLIRMARSKGDSEQQTSRQRFYLDGKLILDGSWSMATNRNLSKAGVRSL
jgi:hypothetical protein